MIGSEICFKVDTFLNLEIVNYDTNRRKNFDENSGKSAFNELNSRQFDYVFPAAFKK